MDALAIPGNGTSSVAVPAGLMTEPTVDLDDPMGSAPVTAYFQFVQQNIQQVYNGNEDAIIAEAERRHKEIMGQWLDMVKTKFRQAIDEVASKHHEELSSVRQQAQSSYNQVQGELSAAKARILKLESERSIEAEARKAELDSLRIQLMHDCQQTVTAITSGAEQGVATLRAEFDERETQLRRELRDAENENYSLQQMLDDLKAKMHAGPELEYHPTSVMNTPVSTPRHDDTKRKNPLETIAAEATARLSGLFAPKAPTATIIGDAPPGAAAPIKPVLPVYGGTAADGGKTPTNLFHSPAPSIREPHKPASSGAITSEQVIELVKSLTQRESDEKPKVKEADHIKLNDMPTPETYRQWKHHVRDEIKSCSDKPDAAWDWLMEVYNTVDERKVLEERLSNPGKFTTLDTKLAAALTRSAKGDLANRIINYKEEKAKLGIQVRGRMILLMFDDYFKTSEEAGSLYRVEDLLNVVKVGDTVADLKRFINRWDATIAGMPEPPHENVLRDILLRQIRTSAILRYDIDLFDRAKEGDHHRSYKFLLQSIKDLIDRERLRENRSRIAERNRLRPGDRHEKNAAPTVDPRRKRSPSRGRSTSREKGICWAFLEGKCAKGKDCKFKHEKPKRDPSKKRQPSRERNESRDKSTDKEKKRMTKEEMAKTPCRYDQQGTCRRGDKCFFKHGEKAAPAPKTKPRKDSPKPKAKGDTKKAAICLSNRFACLATGVPGRSCLKKSCLPPARKRSKSSVRRTTFVMKPEIRTIPARGEHCKMVKRERKYSVHFATSDRVPKSDPKAAHMAKVKARQLAEVVRSFDSATVPSCRFLCTESSLTCRECRSLIKLKTCPTTIPTIVAGPAPREGRFSWLVDSGSEQDLLSRKVMDAAGAENPRRAPHTISLITANGSTEASEVADVKMKQLLEPCTPYLLDECPAVLSVGIKCLDQGYSFVWPANGTPILVRPDEKIVQLRVDGHVPVLDSERKVFGKGKFKKDKPLKKLFAMPGAISSPSDKKEDEGIDEEVPDDEESRLVRSRKVGDLMREAQSAKHQYHHFPKNPFCKVCQRARMLAPQARKKGGESRIQTKAFGDHLIADHVVVRANIEEGSRGERVALVVKDLHTKFRSIYPSQSKSSDEVVIALQHFVAPDDAVEVIYTDNSRELIAGIKELGYRHQTSVEYVDSSKSFIEREVRNMLEGARTNLVQSGMPLQYWPLAIQHFAMATNTSDQLDSSPSPWELRFGEMFEGMAIPFGAKVLFWNNPNRADNTAGKLSPTSVEGVFLGYHVQPGHKWRGEYLVAKLEALDYHVEHNSLTIQRTKKIELLPGGFSFPLRVKQDRKEAIPDDPKLNLIESPNPIPLADADLAEYTPSEAPEGVLEQGGVEPEIEVTAADKAEDYKPDTTPAGVPIPEGYHWDGLRVVKTYKGSKRPKDIPSDYWKTLGPKDRAKLLKEMDEAKSSSSKGSKTTSPATSSQLGSCRSPCVSDTSTSWEAVPTPQMRFGAPAMPRKVLDQPEPHRLPIRELIAQRIKQIEFQVAFELFCAVARLVPRDEVSRTPKAKAALDAEWERLRAKGTWDEARVQECRKVVSEAHRKGETVHLGRIFEACYEKGSELEAWNPLRKFKGRTVFEGNNVRDQNSDHALFGELGSSPASMEAAKVLDAYGSQPGFGKQQADAVQAYVQALFTGVPTWISLPRNRWPKTWEGKYQNPVVPLVLALYGHPDSGGIWEKHLNSRLHSKGWEQILPDVWQSMFYHQELRLLLVVYVDDFKLAGPKEHLSKGWELIKSAVDIGEPEAYDRYFGCHHKEFSHVRLPKSAHPFAHVFDPKLATACQQHRTRDYWHHDPETRTWTRFHLQPRKKLYDPANEGGEFSRQISGQRITRFDHDVTFHGCPSIQAVSGDEGTTLVMDSWSDNPKLQTEGFWTGSTIFTYGEEVDLSAFAAASKNRPGPHRNKREAKNEAKQKRFKPIEDVVKSTAGVMAKPVSIVRYDMSSFLESCVEAYCELAKVDVSSLKPAPTPFTDAGIARPTLSESEPNGRLQPIASKVLMKILFAARMARFDLLRATQSLASRVTKWSTECDVALHRLVAYIHHTKDRFLDAFIGDPLSECQIWLFADADWAGDEEAKSTSGCTTVIVGPNTYFPINSFSKKQTVISTSSTEAEVVAANQALRAEGLPVLALFEKLAYGKVATKLAPKGKYADEEVFTRIDPEINEIRNGNVDSGLDVSNIQGLKVHFPDFCQVKFMEDNQATITILKSGNSSSMKHVNRTQNVSFKWLKQQFEREQFDLVNVGTLYQTADILTKAFTNAAKWEHALRLIGIGQKLADSPVQAGAPTRTVVSKVLQQGGVAHAKTHDRLLIEFCCSADSKLGQMRSESKGCKVLRVTINEDATTSKCMRWLNKEINTFKQQHPKAKVLLYGSLPCTGGSPWGNVNKQTEEGLERIKEQQKEFTKLFKSFAKLVRDHLDSRTFVAFELSRRCRYWHWPSVLAFIKRHNLQGYNFDGCMFGVRDNHGNLMRKSWHIRTNLHELACLEQYMCTHDHTHGQSRGKSLKSAEGYTFEYTDLVHRCFKHSSSSHSAAVAQRALPAIIVDHTMSADQDMRRETLDIFESHFRQIVASGYYLEDGYSEDVDAVLNGVLGQHTAHSVLAGLVEKNRWLEPELGPLIRTSRYDLAAFTGVPTSQDYQTVHILISDSTLCLVSGSKRKPQRFDLADHFQAYRPTYCKHFHHECLWGAELPLLLKRARIAVRSLKRQFPGCMLLVGVVWAGNELIGKKGIEAQTSWPFDHPDGDHYMELQEKVQEELVGFAADMFRYGVHSAALISAPDPDGVGICEVAAVVPNPVFPSTGPLDHSPKLPGFSMGNPASGCYGLVWPSFMDELWLVVMVCPASIGPTEAHLSLVILVDAEEVVVNNAKVPWHDGWVKRETYELL